MATIHRLKAFSPPMLPLSLYSRWSVPIPLFPNCISMRCPTLYASVDVIHMHEQSLKLLQLCSSWAWNRKQEKGIISSSTWIFLPAGKMQHLWLQILPPTCNVFSERIRRYKGFAAQRRWIQAPCQQCFQRWFYCTHIHTFLFCIPEGYCPTLRLPVWSFLN